MDGKMFPQQKEKIKSVFFDYGVSNFDRYKKGTGSESIDSEPVPLLRPQTATNRLCGLCWARSGTNPIFLFRATRGKTGRVRFFRCSSLQPSA